MPLLPTIVGEMGTLRPGSLLIFPWNRLVLLCFLPSVSIICFLCEERKGENEHSFLLCSGVCEIPKGHPRGSIFVFLNLGYLHFFLSLPGFSSLFAELIVKGRAPSPPSALPVHHFFPFTSPLWPLDLPTELQK